MAFAHTSPSVCSSGSYLCPYHGAFQARSEGAPGGLGPCTGEPGHGLPFRSFLVPYISSVLGCSTSRHVALNYHSGSYARIFLRFTYSNWRPYLSFKPFVLPSQNRGKAISQLLSRSPSIVERNPPRVRDRNAAPLLGSNVSKVFHETKAC